MKLATQDGRAVFVLDDEVADVERVSGGRFGPGPMALYEAWPEVVDLASAVTTGTGPLDPTRLGSPVPFPRQVFAIGLNYRSHAEESGMAIPDVPATFTKFPASLAGPFDDIEIVGDSVDWEVELVAVIGRRADRVAEADGWAHVAGLTVGQDVSDRHLQFAAGMQFSLGKSRRGYGPIGPWLVTPDEIPDPDDLALGCSVDGETMQDARTGDLIFGIPRLVAELSAVPPAPPRRRGLHRHPRRSGDGATTPARPRPRSGARVVDRGHRHDPQSLRLTSAPSGNGPVVTTEPVNSVEIDLPIDEAFDLVADASRYPHWLVGAQEVAVGDGWPRPGSSFSHRIGFGPARIPGSTTVRVIDRPTRLVLAAGMGVLGEATVEFGLDPISADRTLVTIAEAPAKGAIRVGWKVSQPLVFALLWGRNRISLDALAEIAAEPQPA